MSEPKYVEIADDIAEQIRRGDLEPGERLPGQDALAEEQRVSKQTVERAYRLLRNDGLVETRRREGTFVTGAHVQSTSAQQWYQQDAEERFQGPREQWQTVDAGAAQAEDVPRLVRVALGLEGEEGAVWRERLLTDAGVPVQWHRSWWSGGVLKECPALADPDPISGGTDAYVREQTGREPARGRERLRARGASTKDAELLDIRRGDPVLEIEHRTVDADEQPLEVCVEVSRGARWTAQDPYDIGGSDEQGSTDE